MLATAAGDALGAGYEFGPPLPTDTQVQMKGGNGFNWAPGEWTDDTSMAVPILQMVAAGRDLRDEEVLDEIVGKWLDWARDAKDVGVQIQQVFGRMEARSASAARVAAGQVHESHGRSAGNGSLMRTAPVVLGYLDDPAALADAARAVSDLTHYETDAGDACVLWCLAMRHAVLTAGLDVRVGLDALPAQRRDRWAALITEAEERQPADFERNGWVVQALQGAWSAIVHRPATDASHLRLALEAAVRGGRDTDTVAAIAGGLLGARWGASAVPAEWRRLVHGWPGLRGGDLVRLALHAIDPQHAADAERMDYAGWGDLSALVRHPFDDRVWLGAVGALDKLPPEVDAVVSLCRVGTAQVPAAIAASNRVEVWLIDQDDPAQNPNLDHVLLDAADAIAALRAEGRTVLLHCVQAQSRTPSVAALYAARHLGVPVKEAFDAVVAALPNAHPKRFLREAVLRLGE